jgi:hypothetical protein
VGNDRRGSPVTPGARQSMPFGWALRMLVALSELVSPVTWAIKAAEPEEAIAWYNRFAISTQKSVELSPLPNCLQIVFRLSSVSMTLQIV